MKILTDILNLNILELNSIIMSLESVFGIETQEEIKQIKKEANEIVEESSKSYELILNSFLPDKKISILKSVKVLLNLGLKETKDILDNVPHTLKIVNNKKEAEEYKQKFEEAGGSISINEK